MFKNFNEMVANVKAKRRGTVIIAAAQTESVLQAAILAQEENLADCLLVGDKSLILSMLEQLDPGHCYRFEIVDVGSDLVKAAEMSVQLAKEGKGDIILKGKTDSGLLLHSVLDKEKGLRISPVISDVLAYEHPEGLKLLSDGGVNIAPNLEEKIAIVKNAVEVAHYMGSSQPKVALLAAVETVNPKMQAAIDAAVISQMNKRNQITGCIVEGPLAFDNAVSLEAAKIKGIESPVAGNADIFIVPNIEAGNIFGKLLTYYCGYRVAHVIVGTKAPILIPSRADSGELKMLCMAMALSCMKV
ncbi:MAG TPA: bifunctional enoyl-CoA hydratase/phosphate acetyltransferase [Candidatus Syntrophosphaera sp.]|jgi:phosphate butyryltransferase|nr:bifunctional enoyl-CoA hydratase/phosphate acetyltransferase [Candidatus Syntrophosphaera sp.]HQM79159.1 bifunctional enoyl-CoA hydratase/phosphate acetyltransferase [Candidatus Syntrophosphaera sp.]